VAAYKVGNRWLVDAAGFDTAIAEHAAGQAELDWITMEYAKHHLLTGPGQRLRTSWGSYRVSRDFHVHESSRIGTGEGHSEGYSQ